MRLICYSDGWTMIPTVVQIIGCDIRTIYKCPHCDKMVLTEATFPCDQPVTVHVDSDLDLKRI